MDYSDKITAYNKLVLDVKNCSKLYDCNKFGRIKLKKCDICNEINLWTYWQGGVDNLNAKILLVGQDWGCVSKSSEQILNYIISREDFSGKSYMDNNTSKTDKNLCDLFLEIGYDVRNDNLQDLFFTNFVLCYREKGLSGCFKQRWANNCSSYFIRLVKIIQPKVIICLGRSVYYSVMRTFEQKAVSDRYNNIIEKGEQTVCVDDFSVHIFPMAHCGVMGTNNRNKDANCNGLDLQNKDWKAIKKYL
ncbi:MAG: uracil-DNA glycosylase family protein [Oscillospiraceae bacterium]|nr:uracil-DNA glycosylase family protein [Oscillospiraceae bacterium]